MQELELYLLYIYIYIYYNGLIDAMLVAQNVFRIRKIMWLPNYRSRL